MIADLEPPFVLIKPTVSEEEFYALGEDSGRLTSDVIPGFWNDVAWLWREPLPSTGACLRELLGWAPTSP